MKPKVDNDLLEDTSVELNPDGEENEEELKTDYLKNLTEVVTWSTDWTIESLINQLERGNIDLNPRFQRRDAWNNVKKSRLIESLIYGLPIPQIVLAEDKKRKGRFIVVDGKQRLITLQKFFKPKENDPQDFLVLTGLRNDDLNNLYCKSLEEKFPDLYENFLNQSIRSVIIKNWPSDNFLYTIFFRLNTGSLKLSPQELRRALKPGPFMDFVDDFSQESKEIKEILKLSKPDYRMRDIDLVIRYYAFCNFANEYNGDYKSFLDHTCEIFNKDWENMASLINEQADDLNSAINLCIDIFGKDSVFRKWGGKKYESRMNRAVFDILVYYFSISKNKGIFLENKKNIKETFNNFCMKDNFFIKSISSNTNNLIETSTRFVMWGQALQKLDNTITIPSKLNTYFKKIRNP
ncbi:MAG: DUF262 domain-containing protein [Deltaproteobacteria bacterium]|nr:DUF262 domain-containing protein [Deltaproteobacteria bacterium]